MIIREKGFIVRNYENNYIYIIDEEFLNNPNFLIFASENDDLVNRWVCMINYFISK